MIPRKILRHGPTAAAADVSVHAGHVQPHMPVCVRADRPPKALAVGGCLATGCHGSSGNSSGTANRTRPGAPREGHQHHLWVSRRHCDSVVGNILSFVTSIVKENSATQAAALKTEVTTLKSEVQDLRKSVEGIKEKMVTKADVVTKTDTAFVVVLVGLGMLLLNSVSVTVKS